MSVAAWSAPDSVALPGEHAFPESVTSNHDGTLTLIHSSRALVLADAIRPLVGNSFLLIESRGRLDIMTITHDSASVETSKDGFAVPTGVTLVGHTAWVSEGQLNLFFDPANKDKKPSLPFYLFAVPTPK